ncbi:hypothetical protein CP02DC14_1476 [Chlamydia psittaci 02DC14]|nr:hypothetical protein CP02DC21_2101 [Chlamydia psittaci 02DC21]EPJ19099.1 hypothetical protein CP02DC23_1196 [Chlamydia psittaci 02DC23]EPL03118.1 hypothetical protein CP02DC14_1476 [Chlamydia psittaci 02DC14]
MINMHHDKKAAMKIEMVYLGDFFLKEQISMIYHLKKYKE